MKLLNKELWVVPLLNAGEQVRGQVDQPVFWQVYWQVNRLVYWQVSWPVDEQVIGELE